MLTDEMKEAVQQVCDEMNITCRKPEPVAWMHSSGYVTRDTDWVFDHAEECEPLYAEQDTAAIEQLKKDLDFDHREYKRLRDEQRGKIEHMESLFLQARRELCVDINNEDDFIDLIIAKNATIEQLRAENDALKTEIDTGRQYQACMDNNHAHDVGQLSEQLTTLQSKADALADALQKASDTFNGIEGAHSADRLICREAAQNIEAALATYKEVNK